MNKAKVAIDIFHLKKDWENKKINLEEFTLQLKKCIVDSIEDFEIKIEIKKLLEVI